MNDYITTLTLDLNAINTKQLVTAAQYDTVRKIKIFITSDGTPVTLTNSMTAYIKILKPDKKAVLNTCKIDENGEFLSFTLTEQILAVPGVAVAEIELVENSKILSTEAFRIRVVSDAIKNSAIESNSDFSALVTLLNKVEVVLNSNGAILVDTSMSETSSNAVANKTIKQYVDEKINTSIQTSILDSWEGSY